MSEKKYNLRLPEELYNALQDRANINRRSMNNEILIILERHIKSPEILDDKNQLKTEAEERRRRIGNE